MDTIAHPPAPLPTEIWTLIFGWLSLLDLCTVVCVSKFFVQQITGRFRPYIDFTKERKVRSDIRAAYFTYILHQSQISGDQPSPPRSLCLAEIGRARAYQAPLSDVEKANLMHPPLRLFAIHGAYFGKQEDNLTALLSHQSRLGISSAHGLYDDIMELLREVFPHIVTRAEIPSFLANCHADLLLEEWGPSIAQHHGQAGLNAFLTNKRDGQVAFRLMQQISDPNLKQYIRQNHLRRYDLAFGLARGADLPVLQSHDIFPALTTWASYYPEDVQTLKYLQKHGTIDIKYLIRFLELGWTESSEQLAKHVTEFAYRQPFQRRIADGEIINDPSFQEALTKLEPRKSFPSDSFQLSLSLPEEILQKMYARGNLRRNNALTKRKIELSRDHSATREVKKRRLTPHVPDPMV